MALRSTTDAPRARRQSVVLISLVVLVEVAWALGLVYLVLHFL